VEVGEEVGEGVGVVLGIEGGLGWHEVAAVEDGVGDAFVVGGGAAGEVGLLEDAEQGGAVERAFGAVVVAHGAVGLEELLAVELLGVELGDGGGRRGGSAGQEQ